MWVIRRTVPSLLARSAPCSLDRARRDRAGQQRINGDRQHQLRDVGIVEANLLFTLESVAFDLEQRDAGELESTAASSAHSGDRSTSAPWPVH